jgi:hypothetical protein
MYWKRNREKMEGRNNKSTKREEMFNLKSDERSKFQNRRTAADVHCSQWDV